MDNKENMERIFEVIPGYIERHPAIDKPQSSCLEAKILSIIVRALGVLPYQKTSEKFTFSYFSTIMMYSIVLVASMSIMSFVVQMEIYKQSSKHAKNFDLQVMSSFNIIVCLELYLFSVSRWMQMKKTVAYMNKWKEFQKCYVSTCGEHLTFRFKYLLSAYIIFILILIIPMIARRHLEVWQEIYLSYMMILYVIVSAAWTILCGALGSAAQDMEKQLQKNFRLNKMTATALRQYRCLWYKLNCLTGELGTVLGISYIFHFLIYFVVQILITYNLLMNLDTISNNYSKNLLMSLGFMVALHLHFNQAHQTTHEVGENFIKHLEDFDRSYLYSDDVKKEIHCFLELISRNPTHINLHGFVTINRKLSTSMMSATVTYMIVLLQFGN